jgi:hypothetical protein
MRIAARLAVASPLCVSALAGLGPSAQALSQAPVSLTIAADDGAGHVQRASLTCRGTTATATGFLRYRPVSACARARLLSGLLTSGPPAGRMCTQIYGGPQTALVRGTVGTRRVYRRFARRDGCEIGDWRRMGPLLPPPS